MGKSRNGIFEGILWLSAMTTGALNLSIGSEETVGSSSGADGCEVGVKGSAILLAAPEHFHLKMIVSSRC